MGRNLNFSTEKLILLIDLYFNEMCVSNIHTGRITAESIARYYREIGQEPELWGRHINGNAEAKDHIEQKLMEINKQIKAIMPEDNIYIWRTFDAYDFYNMHKKESLCGLNIITEYLNNACKLISELHSTNNNLNKQMKELSEQIRENEKIILGKNNISNKHYAQLIKEKQEKSILQKKYNELEIFYKINTETMKQAVLSDMHVIPIRLKANTYAKNNSYLGEEDVKTPSLGKILNRYSVNNCIEEQQFIEQPYWKGLINGDQDEGRDKE